MGVDGGEKPAAEGINPIAWFAQKSRLITLIVPLDPAGVFSHVRRLKSFVIVVDRRVEAAMEVRVGLNEKVVGKYTPPIAKHHFQEIA